MTNEQRQFTAQSQTFPVILVRKKVKNINLHVRSDGTLYISAPARVPWEYIEDFLQKKTDFIVRAMDEMAERKRKFPMLTLSDGDTLYLAGQPYKLDVRLGLQNSIRRSGQTVGNSAAVLALGWIGYQAGAATQTAGALTGIKALVVLIPAIFILGSWIAFRFVWNITPDVRAKMAAFKSGKETPAAE